MNPAIYNRLQPFYWVNVMLRSQKVAAVFLWLLNQSINGRGLILSTIGMREKAFQHAWRGAKKVKAYKALTACLSKPRKLEDFPVIDKESYIYNHPISDLLADDYLDTFALFCSSGSSGRATYWPQLKSDYRLSSRALQTYLEACFHTHRKKTLMVVGLSLGSWVGGDHLSSVLKQCALQVPYPLTIFSPGNRYDEILEIIVQAENFADQIILAVCPSAIGHLKLLAESKNITLPWHKLRYLVLGEAFPETLRLSLQTPTAEPVLFSMYGSADTGALGVESSASIALRQLLLEYPALKTQLGITGDVPHFFHMCAPDAYLETIGNELCITRWQGVPIIRYNLHDQATLYNWQAIRAAVLNFKEAEGIRLAGIIQKSSAFLPPIIAIYGRADRCLILCGTNITENMIGSAVKAFALQPFLTGVYQARILYDEGRQYLSLDLEIKQGVLIDTAVDETIYRELVQQLGAVQPEFAEDWKQIYAEWDHDLDKRIIRLNYVTWPQFSKAIETGIKLSGIQK